jgi:hypothetical protein
LEPSCEPGFCCRLYRNKRRSIFGCSGLWPKAAEQISLPFQ